MPKDIDEAVKKALAFENARKTEERRQLRGYSKAGACY
jgi:hypothetical protein